MLENISAFEETNSEKQTHKKRSALYKNWYKTKSIRKKISEQSKKNSAKQIEKPKPSHIQEVDEKFMMNYKKYFENDRKTELQEVYGDLAMKYNQSQYSEFSDPKFNLFLPVTDQPKRNTKPLKHPKTYESSINVIGHQNEFSQLKKPKVKLSMNFKDGDLIPSTVLMANLPEFKP